jgi:hypothetical protein
VSGWEDEELVSRGDGAVCCVVATKQVGLFGLILLFHHCKFPLRFAFSPNVMNLNKDLSGGFTIPAARIAFQTFPLVVFQPLFIFEKKDKQIMCVGPLIQQCSNPPPSKNRRETAETLGRICLHFYFEDTYHDTDAIGGLYAKFLCLNRYNAQIFFTYN